jgi:hypothetical protein
LSTAGYPEGKCAGDVDFAAVEIGREVAGVGESDAAGGVDVGGERGGWRATRRGRG